MSSISSTINDKSLRDVRVNEKEKHFQCFSHLGLNTHVTNNHNRLTKMDRINISEMIKSNTPETYTQRNEHRCLDYSSTSFFVTLSATGCLF